MESELWLSFLLFQDIEEGSMQHWKTQPSPEVAIRYWNLPVSLFLSCIIQRFNEVDTGLTQP